jgi:hypothetical protein
MRLVLSHRVNYIARVQRKSTNKIQHALKIKCRALLPSAPRETSMMFQLEYAVVKISIEALNSHFQRIRKQVGHSMKKKCDVY